MCYIYVILQYQHRKVPPTVPFACAASHETSIITCSSPSLDKLWMFGLLVLVHSLTCIVTFVTSVGRTRKLPYHPTPMTTPSLDQFGVFVPLVLVQASTCRIRRVASGRWTSKWSVASLLWPTRLLFRRYILVCCLGLHN